MSLYDDLEAAGVEIDSHESDLYFKATEESRAILKRHPEWAKNAKAFTSQKGPPETWIEVPFAFDPFWRRKGRIPEFLSDDELNKLVGKYATEPCIYKCVYGHPNHAFFSNGPCAIVVAQEHIERQFKGAGLVMDHFKKLIGGDDQ